MSMPPARADQKEIVGEFKKQGHFDARRKQFFDTFVADEDRQQQLAELISKLVRCKIEKEPELFSKSRGKVSALIQTELVKRHVERDKLKAKSSGDGNGDVDADKIDPEISGDKYSETELLDRINDLLDSFATSVGESEEIQSEILSQLNGFI